MFTTVLLLLHISSPVLFALFKCLFSFYLFHYKITHVLLFFFSSSESHSSVMLFPTASGGAPLSSSLFTEPLVHTSTTTLITLGGQGAWISVFPTELYPTDFSFCLPPNIGYSLQQQAQRRYLMTKEGRKVERGGGKEEGWASYSLFPSSTLLSYLLDQEKIKTIRRYIWIWNN